MTAKRLIRPKEGRVIAGVAMGLANYFKIDVVIVRIVWVILLIPGGLPGIIPYLLFWIITPSEK